MKSRHHRDDGYRAQCAATGRHSKLTGNDPSTALTSTQRIALRLLELDAAKGHRRPPSPITLRRFSWEGGQ